MTRVQQCGHHSLPLCGQGDSYCCLAHAVKTKSSLGAHCMVRSWHPWLEALLSHLAKTLSVCLPALPSPHTLFHCLSTLAQASFVHKRLPSHFWWGGKIIQLGFPLCEKLFAYTWCICILALVILKIVHSPPQTVTHVLEFSGNASVGGP